MGQEIHAHVIKMGFDSDTYISNSLIHFYGSIGRVIDAQQCFDEMPNKDLVSWNSIIASYSASPEFRYEVFLLFKGMVVNGLRVDGITLAILLSACALVGKIEYGRTTHGYVIKLGIRCGLNVRNALLSMYAKGGCMDTAYRLFCEMAEERDTVSHTIMINGFVELGLVDDARKVFNQMVVKDLVAWNSMINGYAKVKRPKEALKLFAEIDMEKLSPDENTIVSVLLACASLSDLKHGRLAHRYILQRNINRDVVVGTALVNMYAKCGSLEDAMVTFYKMDYKDVFAWTAAITGLADYGYGKEAMALFIKMENELLKPNEATFVSVLIACSRSGLVEEGCFLFDRMVGHYRIKPTVEHFGCLIDLLSRVGLLFQAEKFIESMPPEEKLVGYKTLLSATINYSDINFGEKVAQKLFDLKPRDHGVYILISNFYALKGHWDKVTEMRNITKDMDMRKKVGTSIVSAKD
ncbi:Pentatricopeptide repeat-containing protein [Thalictrum thalictroides]|uniref:Pentatricopeptide repeat-containing protein n=1 Tax=Thalictrum thalictroides TaxID=46969 RepID=A0A7J6VWQ7_THATH|nr:Pentatricopeptide repeat-containing protein [Thalictrum thalictroides]